MRAEYRESPLEIGRDFRSNGSKWCEDRGLAVVCQEKINWRRPAFTDAFSLIHQSKFQTQIDTRVIEDPEFMRQAADARPHGAGLSSSRAEGSWSSHLSFPRAPAKLQEAVVVTDVVVGIIFV